MAALTGLELRRHLRSRSFYVVRFLGAGLPVLAGLLLLRGAAQSRRTPWWGPAGFTPEDLGFLAAYVFETAVYTATLVLFTGGLLLALSSLVEDRSTGVVHLQRLTHLELTQIVGARAVALLLVLTSCLAGALPLLAILGLFGGLDFSWLGPFLVVACAAGLLGAGLGFATAGSRGNLGGALLLLGVPLLLGGGLAILGKLAPSAVARDAPWLPLTAVRAVGGQEGTWLAGTLTILLAAGLLLAHTVRHLPISLDPDPPRDLLRRALDWHRRTRQDSEGEEGMSAQEGSGPGASPVTWLEARVHRMGSPRQALAYLGGSTLLALPILLLPGLEVGVPLLTLSLAVVLPLVAVGVGISLLGGLRRAASLPLLLATPLPARAIVGGEVRAGLLALLLMSAGPLALAVTGGWLTGRRAGFGTTATACLVAGVSVAILLFTLLATLVTRSHLTAAFASLVAALLVPVPLVLGTAAGWALRHLAQQPPRSWSDIHPVLYLTALLVPLLLLACFRASGLVRLPAAFCLAAFLAGALPWPAGDGWDSALGLAVESLRGRLVDPSFPPGAPSPEEVWIVFLALLYLVAAWATTRALGGALDAETGRST